MSARVFVTGIGLQTGLGGHFGESWRHLREGRHAFTIRINDPIEAVAMIPDDGVDPILVRRTARQAFNDAGLDEIWFDRNRTGVVFGRSKGIISLLQAFHEAYQQYGFNDGIHSRWLRSWPHHGASHIASTFDLRGPCVAPVAACATGLIAALQGAELIRRGVCDIILAGAADVSTTNFMLACFRRMGVLARLREGDDPGRAVRPWDRARSGFLIGQGAAVLVLESEEHARARGVLPYAELAGGAFGADAYHMTDLNPDPSNLAGLIGRALHHSGVEPHEIDHVNVHGTATRVNDPLECQAIRLALGEQANKVACSANKAQIGHTLGAAGAVELAFTALAVRDGFVPPTLNLEDPDPLCDLDGTPHVGRWLPIRAALKLSIGFGGHLAAAVLRQVDGPRRPGP